MWSKDLQRERERGSDWAGLNIINSDLSVFAAAHDEAVFVKTYMTFAAEIGEWCMLFQSQTLFTLLVTLMLWNTHWTWLSMLLPAQFSPLRRVWVTFLSLTSQWHSWPQSMCTYFSCHYFNKSWPVIYSILMKIIIWGWQMNETVPLLCWRWGHSTVRGRPCFWLFVWNSRWFRWNGRRLHQNGEDEHSAPATRLEVRLSRSESALCL